MIELPRHTLQMGEVHVQTRKVVREVAGLGNSGKSRLALWVRLALVTGTVLSETLQVHVTPNSISLVPVSHMGFSPFCMEGESRTFGNSKTNSEKGEISAIVKGRPYSI
jgi:hypothetical protein